MWIVANSRGGRGKVKGYTFLYYGVLAASGWPWLRMLKGVNVGQGSQGGQGGQGGQ